jgi:hypothetical protein
MKRKLKTIIFDAEIDKLTNSIENSTTGENFETYICEITKSDLRIIRKGKWRFNWVKEFGKKDRRTFKLETVQNPGIIHGLISFGVKSDHVFMYLLESARFNVGDKKAYKGVPANLVAFACKKAFEKGFSGIVVFISKTTLIDHYKNTLKANVISGQRMYIHSKNSLTLVKQYFKDFKL